MTSQLNIAAVIAVSYLLLWFLTMLWHRRKGSAAVAAACPANYRWDDAPLLPICQRQCAAGEISDGRGECVSAAIPFTKMSLDSLGKGKL